MRRHVRVGRRAVRRRARQHGAQRPEEHRRDPRALRLLGRHRRDPPRRANRVGRPRLRGHRPHADAADPAGPGPRVGRRHAVPDPVHVGRGVPPRLRPRRGLRRHQLTRAPGVQRRVPPRRRQPPVQVHLARHAPEVRRRVHVHLRGDRARLDVDPRLPVRRRHGDGDRRVHAADLGRLGLRAHDEGGDDRHLRARLRRASRWPRVDVECQPPARLGGVDELPAGDLRAVAPRERGADGRRRGDGALLGRLRLAAGVRQRDRPRRLPAQRADDGSGVRALSGRAAHRSAPPAVGGAQQPRVVRAGRALPRPRPGAVQLLVAHPIAADLAREPAAARSGMAAVGGGLVPGAGRRQARPGADVRAVPAARARARQPCRRVADGAVQGGRRVPHRLALRPLRRAGQGRCRSGLHRDDVRVARGSHHAGLHRPVRARARGGVDATHRLRPRRDQRQDLLPGRPLGPQGLDAARLGADRHPAASTATGR